MSSSIQNLPHPLAEPVKFGCLPTSTNTILRHEEEDARIQYKDHLRKECEPDKCRPKPLEETMRGFLPAEEQANLAAPKL